MNQLVPSNTSVQPSKQANIDLLAPGFSWSVLIIVLLNVIFFIISEYVYDHGSSVRKIFSLWPTTPARIFYQPWRLIMFQFMHLSITHMALNMFVIIQGGPTLVKRFGTLGFLALYFLGAAAAAFLYEILIVFLDPNYLNHSYPKLSGASGGVYI